MLRTIGAGGSLQEDIWSKMPGGGTPVFFWGGGSYDASDKIESGATEHWDHSSDSGDQWLLCTGVICYISSVWFGVASLACLGSRNFGDSNN